MCSVSVERRVARGHMTDRRSGVSVRQNMGSEELSEENLIGHMSYVTFVYCMSSASEMCL